MPLVEYLYADVKRLDSYIEQFSSLTKYDKVPVWTSGISFTGLQAGASQSRPARQATQHEKVEMLLDHLRKSGQLFEGRPVPDCSEVVTPFRLERCEARRVFIPASSQFKDTFTGLALWFSHRSGPSVGSLTLIEEFGPDDAAARFQVGTPCSALRALLNELPDELEKTIIVSDQFEEVVQAEAKFARNPLQVLARLGARIAAPRTIRSLYRVRALFGESDQSGPPDLRTDRAVGIIGYPLFIAAA